MRGVSKDLVCAQVLVGINWPHYLTWSAVFPVCIVIISFIYLFFLWRTSILLAAEELVLFECHLECQLDLSVQKNGFRKCGYSSGTNGSWNQKTEKHFKFILDVVLLYRQLCSQQHKSVWTYCRCKDILKYGLQKSKCGQAILHDFGFLCMLSSCCSLL